jgi:Alr-MurF fusion protein
MHYTASEIHSIVKGQLYGNAEKICEQICIDSRHTDPHKLELFVALRTKKNNGHLYLNDAANKGISVFLVSELPQKISQNHTYILVNDTLEALQTLAAYHRLQFDIPVIGITGSNGKTIIKEWLYQLLSQHMQVCANPNSYNSQIGVALSVLRLNQNHQIAIFEAGISQTNEMEQLQKMIQPSIGIISNIGSAHDEGFKSKEEKLKEKLILFRNCKELIYCKDHTLIDIAVQNTPIKSITWTKQNHTHATFHYILSSLGKSTQIQFNGFTISVPFNDEASLENIGHCISLLNTLNISIDQVKTQMEHLQSLSNRLEVKKGINGNTIINDSYSNDTVSLNLALQFQNKNNILKQKKVLILSDLLQSGQDKEVTYSEVAQLIHQSEVDILIGIGNALSDYAERFQVKEKIFFQNTDRFLNSFNYKQYYHHSILIKGARSFRFEKIDLALQQKVHETVLEVKLNAFIHNLNFYRGLLKPTTKIMAMVKAFAYGSGNVELANLLQNQKLDYLAVAFADEGVELRQAGIYLPIMVMNPDSHSLETLIEYQLEPEIYSFKLLQEWIELKKNRIPINNGISSVPAIHLKLDTGMHRLGFELQDIDQLIQTLKYEQLSIASIFSHLAASDNPEHDAFTKQQIDVFKHLAEKISIGLQQKPLLHIANTSGIMRHSASHLEMVRLGIGLYGVGNQEQSSLELAGKLSTVISQIKHISVGETVGYNRYGKADKKIKIATIPIGYADGFSRLLSRGKGKVYIHGQAAPIIGNICMDMCMVDITAIDCEEGDRAVIYETIDQLNQLAQDSQTIPYEILTNVSARVKRVYVNE